MRLIGSGMLGIEDVSESTLLPQAQQANVSSRGIKGIPAWRNDPVFWHSDEGIASNALVSNAICPEIEVESAEELLVG